MIDDIRDHPEFRLHPVIAEHGIVFLLNVPIGYDSVAWGVLEADSDQPGHFDEPDAEFLEIMASLLGIALQHRGKDNLAIVSAMLARASRAATVEQNACAAEWFGELMQRVAAIALAQDRLSILEGGAGEGTDIELAGYLRALLGSLDLSRGGRLLFEAELEACMLPVDKAVAVGLVVNELVTNAGKHACPEGAEGGVVRVALRCDTDRAEAAITVSDEGRGADPTMVEARRAAGGQGSGRLRHLARQLGGDVE